jgi:branched-chain amino acid transport system substrate-binding protein
MVRFNRCRAGSFKKAGGVGFVMFGLICFSVCLTALSTVAVAAEKGPIKIGFVAPLTGNFAQIGLDMVEGFKMFWNENNNTVAGRKVEIIVEDEAGVPGVAIAKVRKLINHDKVNLITGVFQGNVAYAIAPICVETETPFVNTAAAADDLTQRKRSKYVLRICHTGGELGHIAGDFGYNKLGWRRVVTLGFDYSWGHECIGGFQRVFEELGGKVIQKTWVPLGSMDFAPYVTALKTNADGIFEVVTGAASIRFIKAMKTSGLMDKWKMIAPGTSTDETLLPSIGDEGIGVYSLWNYSAALKNPQNIKFIEKVKKTYNRDVTMPIAINYTGGDWIMRAIKAVNGDVEDKDKFLQALRSVEIPDALQGALKLDKYGHAIQNYYVRRVEKVGNAYQNTVMETYPLVNQFYKYDPETFMKSPVYSRDYPPCKFCE